MGQTRRTVEQAAKATAALLAAVVLFSVGCERARMQYLTDKRYAPRQKSYPIDLYQGGVDRPCEEIAWLDSRGVDDLTTESRRLVIADLKRRALEVGGDAVTDVMMLQRAERGYVRDPMTPFRSWKQGWTEVYFLRGKAVRFKEPLIETGEGAGVLFTEDELTGASREAPESFLPLDERKRTGSRSWLLMRKEGPAPRIPEIEEGP